MSKRRLNVGPFDCLFYYPDGLGRKVLTLGGLLGGAPQGEKEPDPIVDSSKELSDLEKRVGEIEWYHTIDLPDGVTTPGWFDLRHVLPEYPLPESLEGKRVLDVATFDGFWAYEFEKRGAAEVVALDIDSFNEVDMCPRNKRKKTEEYLNRKTGEGFKLVHEVKDSKVNREVCNVYDLSPERLGMFDMVFLSDLLLHLQAPMRALANVASVTKEGGQAIIADVYDPSLPGKLMNYRSGDVHNTWWDLSYGALEQMLIDAGFKEVNCVNKFNTGYRGQREVLAHAAFVCKN